MLAAVPSVIRFGLVIACGLALDLASAWCLANMVGLPLEIAAVAGFGVGAVFNYVLHEFWTFRSDASGLSLRRLTLYVASTVAVLGVRVGTIAVLSLFIQGAMGSLIVLASAACVSFFVNYGLSRVLVYRSARGHR